ncbi:MAG: alkaline phosphatase, partial [Bacteroidales bacterium]|nr:alkaline phosphatase [Bacteroidales bacterium]
CREAGYTVVRGYKAYAKAAKKAQRMVLLQPEKPSHGDRTCLPYAIDRQQGDLTLTDITRAGLSFLMSKQGEKQGFFLMVEGGKIDYACHANDAATVFHETIDMDEAVRVAYEFYMQHPDETLIVVTADHETGGIVLGRGPYELHLDVLKYQKLSAEAYTAHLRDLHTKLGDKLTWERMKQDLTEYWGFWKGVSLNQHQSERLENAFKAFISGKDKGASNMYANLGGIADAARRTLAEIALVGWQSGGHSNGYVPVFAIGVGAERFGGQIDNTQIPLRIAEAAGWQQTAQ